MEFIEATSKIEAYYNKEYTSEQRKIMYEELQEIKIERYRKLISEVLKNCRFLPKIVDFIEINTKIPNTNNQKKEKVECKKCNSTGYITYKKRIKDGYKEIWYEYVAICSCGNAKQYKGWEITDREHRSNYYMPLAKELNLIT